LLFFRTGKPNLTLPFVLLLKDAAKNAAGHRIFILYPYCVQRRKGENERGNKVRGNKGNGKKRYRSCNKEPSVR